MSKRFFYHKTRKIYQGPFLDIKGAPGAQNQGRLLLVVPRKVGSAPERNRFKRRMRALFYELRLADKGFDIACYAKPGITALTFDELKQIMVSLCTDTSS